MKVHVEGPGPKRRGQPVTSVRPVLRFDGVRIVDVKVQGDDVFLVVEDEAGATVDEMLVRTKGGRSR